MELFRHSHLIYLVKIYVPFKVANLKYDLKNAEATMDEGFVSIILYKKNKVGAEYALGRS